MVHRVDGDVAFGGEGSDFDEMGAFFRFGPALEFCTPFGAAAVELFGADEWEGIFGSGFHGRGLVKVHFFGAEVADKGSWVADGDLDVGFELDAGTDEGRFAFLKDAAHGVKGAVEHRFQARDCGVQDEAIAVAAEPVEIAFADGFVVREVAVFGL